MACDTLPPRGAQIDNRPIASRRSDVHTNAERSSAALGWALASFEEYITGCIELAGSADCLGKLLGFTTGTRVIDLKRGLGGHGELAEMLRADSLRPGDESGIGLAGVRPGDLGRVRLLTVLDSFEEQVHACRRLLSRI